MREFCHRCGGELPAGDGVTPFCPHCGAPQIYLLDHEQPAEAQETGAAPPPRPQQVEWKTAIRCAALVAVVAAVLSLVSTRVPVMSPLSSLWTISGSLIAVGLYQKRRPQAWMDAGVGARIGIVGGIGPGDLSVGVDGWCGTGGPVCAAQYGGVRCAVDGSASCADREGCGGESVSPPRGAAVSLLAGVSRGDDADGVCDGGGDSTGAVGLWCGGGGVCSGRKRVLVERVAVSGMWTARSSERRSESSRVLKKVDCGAERFPQRLKSH